MKPIKPGLKEKLLKLAATFEGGWEAVAGNFDGAILSFGPLQWNFKSGTLVPLLNRIQRDDPAGLRETLGDEFCSHLGSPPALIKFVEREVLDGRELRPEWRERFKKLARRPAATAAFLWSAEPYFNNAVRLATLCKFESERGLALCFDIAVQNGAPRLDHTSELRRRLAKLTPKQRDEEWERLKVLAQVVADCANPRWKRDVLSRKLSIALGSTKMSEMPVHQRHFDLEADYGIKYSAAWYEES